MPTYWDEEPEKRRAIPKAVKQSVWSIHIGANKAEGQCYVCKRTIHISDFDVGHNKARSKGGSDNISNLRPICRPCNASMGTQSIESYKAKYYKPKKSKVGTQQKTKRPKKKDEVDEFDKWLSG